MPDADRRSAKNADATNEKITRSAPCGVAAPLARGGLSAGMPQQLGQSIRFGSSPKKSWMQHVKPLDRRDRSSPNQVWC